MRIDEAVEAYTAYLRDVRRLSDATVRAYRSDLADFADFSTTASADAAGTGTVNPSPVELGDADLELIREWLWAATKRGDARSTIARRTAAPPRGLS